MITFLVCLAALVIAYFTYGKYLEKVCGIDAANPVPSKTMYDGVDYIPMPRWKVFLIQLLNIAGLGPIFGALLGAAYGPVAFLWITLGGIFMGAMHDFVAGVISLKEGGKSLPEIVGNYLGNGTRAFMRVFSVFLMVLVGAVFMSQPAELIASNVAAPVLETPAFSGMSWELVAVLAVILIYYILATLLPIDKLIGRIYPLFGIALLVMAVSILYILLVHSDTYIIPELTSLENQIADADKFPIVPMLFTTIACGAISGFHATQSPMMARCMTNEKQSRSIFYGAMIAESVVALIWAAIGMAFLGRSRRTQRCHCRVWRQCSKTCECYNKHHHGTCRYGMCACRHHRLCNYLGRYGVPLCKAHRVRYVRHRAEEPCQETTCVVAVVCGGAVHNLCPAVPDNMELLRLVQPDTGGNYIVVHYCISFQERQACDDCHAPGTDNDIRLFIVYLHLSNDVRNGEPHAGIYTRWSADGGYCRSGACKGKKLMNESGARAPLSFINGICVQSLYPTCRV